MKGLLLKDFYMIVRYCRSFLLVAGAFLAVSMAKNTGLFFFLYPCMFCSMIPVTLMSYDERSRWNQYSGALPYTRAQLVSAKYLIGLGASGLMLIVSVAAAVIRSRITGESGYAGELLQTVELLAAVSMVVPSLCLPFMFRLGVEKGRIVFYLSMVIVAGSAMFLSSEPSLGTAMEDGLLPGSLHLPLLIIVGLYALSWRLAIAFYRTKEL